MNQHPVRFRISQAMEENTQDTFLQLEKSHTKALSERGCCIENENRKAGDEGQV